LARIIDLTTHSAVYATRLLVESGHEVIRVELPQGDSLRRLGPFLADAPELEHGAYHLFLNAGKQSLTLDLASAAGRQIFLSLVGTADAVVGQSPSPVSREDINKANPRLVTVEVDDDASPELCAYARSGLLAITGHPGSRPAVLGGHIVYGGSGLYVALAATVALYRARRLGRGSTIRVSLQQCLETFVEAAMVAYTVEDRITQRRGYRGASTAVSGAFPCEDGYWMISVPHSPTGWRAFVEWVGDPVLIADTSLEHEANRLEKRDIILDRLAEWSRQFKKQAIVEEAQQRHIPASPVATALDMVHDPQLQARGFFEHLDHPTLGSWDWNPRGAVGVVSGRSVGPAPRLGQHTAEILQELGYSEEDHRSLLVAGVV
jgi:crotonobetainyl-CoA:carnitine CoA-transferase CaiB-like acyl-CoA transferase